MVRKYSRLKATEERKNIRKAFVFAFLTIATLAIFIFLGIPAIAKFAAFLTDLRKSGEPVEKVDTTPPVPPKLDPLPEFTNQVRVELKGSTEPGATVVLFINNKKDEVLANKGGVFTYSLPLNKGENTISALAKDSAGNESQESSTHKITYDDEPPEIEVNSPEDGTTYYGSKQRQIVIEGKTEELASVTINDRIVVVESDGSFAFATTLTEGENSFTIKAQDSAGNATEKSITLHFSL